MLRRRAGAAPEQEGYGDRRLVCRFGGRVTVPVADGAAGAVTRWGGRPLKRVMVQVGGWCGWWCRWWRWRRSASPGAG